MTVNPTETWLAMEQLVEKALAVDASHADFRDPDVALQTVAGTGGHEAALLVRRSSGTTLILNDLIGNLRRKGGFEGWLLHMLGFGSSGPQIPTAAKIMMLENKAELRQQLLAGLVEHIGELSGNHQMTGPRTQAKSGGLQLERHRVADKALGLEPLRQSLAQRQQFGR